jgi:hypothetical protein
MGFVFDSSKAMGPSVAAGTYNATVKSAKFASAAETGNPMINLRWEIEIDSDDRPPVVFDRLVFATGSAFRVVNYLEATQRGTTALDGQTIDEAFLTELAEQLLGDTASLVIELKPDTRPSDDNKPRPMQPNVKKYLPYGSAKSADKLIDLL